MKANLSLRAPLFWRGAVVRAVVLCLLSGAAAAQTSNLFDTASAAPRLARASASEKEQAVNHYLDCRWTMGKKHWAQGGVDDPQLSLAQAVLDNLDAKHRRALKIELQDDGRVHGPVRAFGVTFDELFMAAWSGVFLQGTGRRADMPALLKTLRARG